LEGGGQTLSLATTGVTKYVATDRNVAVMNDVSDAVGLKTHAPQVDAVQQACHTAELFP